LEAWVHGLAGGQASWHRTSRERRGGLTYRDWLRACPRTTIAWVPLPFLVTSSVIADATWYGNINPLAIGYAFRPRLRSRLTLSRRTLLRKPWTIGGGDSHPACVTHAGILASCSSTTAHAVASVGHRNALLPLGGSADRQARSFGDVLKPR
jgi:hypothetical protein